MYRIAVVFESSPFDRKGLFNAVHNRVRMLSSRGIFHVDAYCIHSRDTRFTRYVRKTPVVPDVTELSLDGISYRLLWYDFSITDHILVEKFHHEPFFFNRFLDKTLPVFEGYDLLISHSFTGALLASKVKDRFGIPFLANWHGSDIHTHPFRNPLIFDRTAEMLSSADRNFFVSRSLMELSGTIAARSDSKVLYNGVSDDFKCLRETERQKLRSRYGAGPDDKVVAYAGSLTKVKNVTSLQPIFNRIAAIYPAPLKFWVVGDGKLRHIVEPSLMSDSSIDVTMFGNVGPETMPLLMNCMDVLVLPSLNEGLGMVAAEAIACGANVVGADAGGIPEVTGSSFCVPHGDDFVRRFADKVVECLDSRPSQHLLEDMSWEKTCDEESGAITMLLEHRSLD